MDARRTPITNPAQRPEAADIEVDPDRRRALRRLGMASVLPVAASVIGSSWTSRARAQQRLMPTPSQTEGPFYPVEIPADSDHDLLVNGSRTYTPAHRTKLSGSVVDVDGKPLKGAVVEIWQCDENGHYHHPSDGGADPAFQGFGRSSVDADGRYGFVTMRPARYTGRTPHIHVKVKLGRKELLTTQLYVAGDPGNERDGLWRRLNAGSRAALTVPFEEQGSGWLAATFALVVEA